MSWDVLGIVDLEDIPSGQHVSWIFITTFMRAFKERLDFAEGPDKAEDYEDMLLNGPQISRSELVLRFSQLNGLVKSFFNNNTWYKEETWLQLSTYTSGLATDDDPDGGMGVIDLEEWEEIDLRELLTDDVYELIFDSYAYDSNFRPSYWSGLYKLLRYVIKYRKLTIKLAYEANPTEPYLVVNGTSIGSGLEAAEDMDVAAGLAAAIASTRTPDSTSSAGSRDLYRCVLSTESIYRTSYGPFHDPEHITFETGATSAYAKEVTGEPFCVVPAQMDIQFLVDRYTGDEYTTTDRQDYEDFPNGDEFIFYELDISSAKTDILPSTYHGFRPSEFEPIEDTYVPDYTTYHSLRAENPKFGVSFLGDRCKVDLSSIEDIRDSHSIEDPQAPKPPTLQETHNGAGNTQNESKIVKYQTAYHGLNLAMCELPQDFFEFPAETEE
jgi:hypothetical protein